MKTKPRDIKIAFYVCFALIAVYYVSMLWIWVRASTPVWPPVSNPNTLLTECATLVDRPGQVEEPNWPPSVQSFNPRGVYVLDDCVAVTISGGGIGAGWGYLVYPDGRSDTTPPSELLIHEYVCPGLFKYVNDE